jgi:hypothetical protein
MLDTVEQAFGEPVSMDMAPGDVGDGAVHGPAVVTGGCDRKFTTDKTGIEYVKLFRLGLFQVKIHFCD